MRDLVPWHGTPTSQAWRWGTCDEGWHTPAQHVVEAHGARVDVAHFGECPVQVQSLQQGPGEGAEVQEVQQDGDDCASKLRPGPAHQQGRPLPAPRAGFCSGWAGELGWGAWEVGGTETSRVLGDSGE